MQEPKGAALGGTEKILEVKSAAKATGSTGEECLSTSGPNTTSKPLSSLQRSLCQPSCAFSGDEESRKHVAGILQQEQGEKGEESRCHSLAAPPSAPRFWGRRGAVQGRKGAKGGAGGSRRVRETEKLHRLVAEGGRQV